MKTTLPARPLANPRRTTLAHLKDLTDLRVPAQAAAPAEEPPARPLPAVTANPRRTKLDVLPGR